MMPVLRHCLTLLLSAPLWAATIVAPSDVIRDYRLMLGKVPPEQRTHYDGPYSRRDTVELLLTHQALRLGGYKAAIRLQAVDSYARTLAELQSGRATATGTSVWLADLTDKQLDPSPALIESGKMVAGLYTARNNWRALDSRDAAAIRELSAVSNRAWTADWQVLSSMKLARLDNVPLWTSMVRMVATHRADFLLAPFQPAADGSLVVEGQRLVPIPGVKLVLPGSRHLAISRTAPDAEAVQVALNRGLARLREQQVLMRAYQASGCLLPADDKRVRINP